MESTRRHWLSAAAAGALGQLASQPLPAAVTNDDAWHQISEAFPVDRKLLNFNHAGIGTCPRPVVEGVVRRTWRGEDAAPATIFSYGPKLEPVRQGLAALLGCDAEEVAITRNATESLNAILLGVPLKPGDEVLTTTLDYWAMLDALTQREQRDGITVKKLQIPVPCTDLGQIVRLFEESIGPRTKLILISHPINLNGQLFPVGAISRMAQAHGVEVVVDAAQSFALVDYKMRDLECDYLGTSLHKWLQAPKGTGLLYVRRDRIEKVWPLFAAGTTRPKTDIRKFELYGTWPETIVGIADALAFHNAIGSPRKEARLRAVTARWVEQVRDVAGIGFHTGFGDALSCGITCVELKGIPAGVLRKWLLEQRGIVTMDISRRTSEFAGIRISPGLSNTGAEVDALVKALREARGALRG